MKKIYKGRLSPMYIKTVLLELLIALFMTLLLALILTSCSNNQKTHSFEIGTQDFLLDSTPFQIRCGELHYARIAPEYWRHRLQMMKALGMNTICAYAFWNFHERTPVDFTWEGEADIARFCEIAQEEGLWVILRPGPYSCAEWEMGGLPWWLLKNDSIVLRSQDPIYMEASQRYLKALGEQLAPLQITNGGPILMVQVENEYGFYGKDAEYMGKIKEAIIDAGFEVPLFACNPKYTLKNGFRDDIFQVVNFSGDPEKPFQALRELQPSGPLMCGEYYSAWFDTWGTPHNTGNVDRYINNMEKLLKMDASFSIYMAHGGTSFGFWAGCDRPFKPDVSSYDYAAPVSEAGWTNEKFDKTRELISKYLQPGEDSLPEPPARNPTITIPEFKFNEFAPLFENLPEPLKTNKPKTMEYYNQGQGSIIYRTVLDAGNECMLEVGEIHDFAWVFINGEEIGILDRRTQKNSLQIPARDKESTIDIFVHAMGRINFGEEVHDRKGLIAPIQFIRTDKTLIPATEWYIYNLAYDKNMLDGLIYKKPNSTSDKLGVWKGEFELQQLGDVFLDVRNWGKGVLWVNGYCMGRYWNIGPTQTMYVPAPWLKKGINEIQILDLIGPEKPVIAGLAQPILNELQLKKDFSFTERPKVKLNLENFKPHYQAEFENNENKQEIKFEKTAKGKFFCLEAKSALDGKPFAALAELDVLDEHGNALSHKNWTIAYVSSEEMKRENGMAENAIDGQAYNYWHTEFSAKQPGYPHYLVINLGKEESISGFCYIPRNGKNRTGRIKAYSIYIENDLFVKN